MHVGLIFFQQARTECGYPTGRALAHAVRIHGAVSQQACRLFPESRPVSVTEHRPEGFRNGSPVGPVSDQGLDPHGPRHGVDHLAAGVVPQLFQNLVQRPGGATDHGGRVAGTPRVFCGCQIAGRRTGCSDALARRESSAINVQSRPFVAGRQLFPHDDAPSTGQDVGLDRPPVSHSLRVDWTGQPRGKVWIPLSRRRVSCRSVVVNCRHGQSVYGLRRR